MRKMHLVFKLGRYEHTKVNIIMFILKPWATYIWHYIMWTSTCAKSTEAWLYIANKHVTRIFSETEIDLI